MTKDGFEESPSTGDSQVRVAQIIVGAMMIGVLVYLTIVALIRASGKLGLFAVDPWNILPPGGLLSVIALVMGSMVTLMSFIVPKVALANARKTIAKQKHGQAEPGSFDGLYVTQIIIGIAFLESGAFFNGVALFVEGHIPNLIAALVLVGLIAARFPSRVKIDAFAKDQQALVFEERQSA